MDEDENPPFYGLRERAEAEVICDKQSFEANYGIAVTGERVRHT